VREVGYLIGFCALSAGWGESHQDFRQEKGGGGVVRADRHGETGQIPGRNKRGMGDEGARWVEGVQGDRLWGATS